MTPAEPMIVSPSAPNAADLHFDVTTEKMAGESLPIGDGPSQRH
jgi:hypothetical protein